MTFKHKHIKIIRQDAETIGQYFLSLLHPSPVLSAYRLSSCMQYKKFPNSSLLFKLHHSILRSLAVPLNSITTGQGNRHGCDILFSYWAVKCISPSYVQHGNKQHKFVLCDLFVWPRGQVWYFYLFLWWSLIFFHFNWMEVVFLHSFIPEPKLSFQLGLLKYMNLIWLSLVLIYATMF